MSVRPSLIMLTGAVLVAVMALLWGSRTAPALAGNLTAQAAEVIAASEAREAQVSFVSDNGWPTRHALLTAADDLDEGTRADLAIAVAGIPGVAGINWFDGSMLADGSDRPLTSMHCQDDVAAILGARTIRFEESSADLTTGNDELLGEVAAALRPCLGAIIAIIGHTDSSGDAEANLALSRDRASKVRQELIARGIPRDGLRARGVGDSRPVEGLDPADPANRRIEFSVIAKVPLVPTPVDTPGPR